MIAENEDEINEYLKTKNCRGCNNRCTLADPMCNRSRIWIKEAIEKYYENIDNSNSQIDIKQKGVV